MTNATATNPTPPSAVSEHESCPSTAIATTSNGGAELPRRVTLLARLGPEHLPIDGDVLLEHVRAAAEDLQPDTIAEWLDVVRVGRHNHSIFNMQAYADMLLRLNRRLAIREIVKPGSSRKIGEPKREPKTAAQIYAAHDESCVRLDDGNYPLDPQYFGNDEAFEQTARDRLKDVGIKAFGIEAEAFRLSLPNLTVVTQLITTEEARRELLLDAFFKRRQRRRQFSEVVVDAEIVGI